MSSCHGGFRPHVKITWKWVFTALLLVVGLSGQRWLVLRGPRFWERWPDPVGEFGPWHPIVAGLDYSRANLRAPRPIKAHALRIDLLNERLELVVNPTRESEQGWVRSAFPSSWLRSLEALACINATPFSPEAIFPGTRVRLEGLAVAGGLTWAEKQHNLDALILRSDGQFRFLQGTQNDATAFIGVGGFLVTLRSGQNLGENSPQDAATVVGLSADRRWMLWLVVDGGQPGYSEGATPKETAELIRQLGAADAINLDGGSSTTLVTGGSWTGAMVRNRPRHPAYAGMQRPVGNVLAVRLRKASE